MSSKNTFFNLIIVLLIAAFFIVSGEALYPTLVNAEDNQPYYISNYNSNVILSPDGAAIFEESITYRLQQDIDEPIAIVKPIPMGYSSQIEDIEVLRREERDPSNSVNNTEADYEWKPLVSVDDYLDAYDDAYYMTPADEDEEVYHIVIPIQGSKHDEVQFVYRYKMLDTVFLYRDTAVFYWRFIEPEQGIKVDNINIDISMPGAESVEEWNGYAKGTVHAAKELLEEDGVFRISAQDIPKESYLDSVLLLPNVLFPEGRKIIDNEVAEEVLYDMSLWEDESERIRKEKELQFYGSWGIAAISILLCIGTALLLYIKTRTSKKQMLLYMEYDGNDLPDPSLSPAEVGVLMKGKPGAGELFATVLKLIQGRFLELQGMESREGILRLREDMQTGKLKAHEEYILYWLIVDLGNKNTLSLAILDELLASFKKKYRSRISTWESLIFGRTGKYDAWEKITTLKAWGIGAVLVSLIAAVLSGWILGNHFAALLVGIFAFALTIYVIVLKKPSEAVLKQKAQWKMFGEELKKKLDQGTSHAAHIPLDKWEEYLIYAIPLDIGSEIFDKLLQIYKNRDFEDGNLTILYNTNHSWLNYSLRRPFM
jgi:uncharacterized membrane protein